MAPTTALGHDGTRLGFEVSILPPPELVTSRGPDSNAAALKLSDWIRTVVMEGEIVVNL